jgi:hypothetical protein
MFRVRLRRRKSSAPDTPPPRPPEGVRVQRADGTVVPCGVLLREVRDGIAHWIAVPMGEICPPEGDRLLVGVQPGMSSVILEWSSTGVKHLDLTGMLPGGPPKRRFRPVRFVRPEAPGPG